MTESSFAHRLAVSAILPRLQTGMGEALRIGFLAPLSGPVESWGLPGLHGCRLWASWINRAGGLLLRGRRYPVEIHSFDCGYDPRKAVEGAKDLVLNKNVRLLLMLGGDTFSPIRDFVTRHRVLTTTLLPSDLSPDTPYLIAPSELHPLYNVTGVNWLARRDPHAKKIALCSQRDALGDPSLATYRAALAAEKMDVVKEIRYDPTTFEANAIVDAMLAENPDVLCWCTSYTPMVHAMSERAYSKGFKGRILSCTMDDYPALIAKTSPEFMEGSIFQFPDFDDPMLADTAFFFHNPHQFYEDYTRQFPNSWSAVSWEYVAALDIWLSGVEKADTLSAVSVLAAMKQMKDVKHVFGLAQWWGEELFGISNALVGDWPVVEIRNKKARIVEFGSIPQWLMRHKNRLREEMHRLDQLWEQRIVQKDALRSVFGMDIQDF